jgi:hypothetical protein
MTEKIIQIVILKLIMRFRKEKFLDSIIIVA